MGDWGGGVTLDKIGEVFLGEVGDIIDYNSTYFDRSKF